MPKKFIDADIILDKLTELCIDTNCTIDSNFYSKILEFKKKSNDSFNNEILNAFEENKKIAEAEKLPVCQDTGMCTFFVEYGNKFEIKNGNLNEILNKAVSQAYTKGFLRKSIVKNPITRFPNTLDNTPVIVYTDMVQNNNLKIWFLPKGGGSENVSTIKMFNPSTNLNELENFIVDTIKAIGSKACPPYKIGVCFGGTFDYCAMMSKKILIDEFADSSTFANELNQRLINKINKTNIGPQGVGGTPTVVKINCKLLPTHIAMLPVAISVSCNAVRIGRIEF